MSSAPITLPDTGTVDAEQTRLAESGLASVDERETICCYAKQDKFWVQGTPDGERWEIYAVTGDSQTFWGEDGEARYEAAEAALDAPAGSRCCGTEASAAVTGAGASASACC